jgi:formylmethanofuran dehydrogenase subunit E
MHCFEHDGWTIHYSNDDMTLITAPAEDGVERMHQMEVPRKLLARFMREVLLPLILSTSEGREFVAVTGIRAINEAKRQREKGCSGCGTKIMRPVVVELENETLLLCTMCAARREAAS